MFSKIKTYRWRVSHFRLKYKVLIFKKKIFKSGNQGGQYFFLFVFETNKSLFITITERREERRNAFPSSQKQKFSLSYLLAPGREGDLEFRKMLRIGSAGRIASQSNLQGWTQTAGEAKHKKKTQCNAHDVTYVQHLMMSLWKEKNCCHEKLSETVCRGTRLFMFPLAKS